MPVLATSNLALPPHLASGVFEQAKYGSVVAALKGADPMLFGDSQFMTFSDPKAEFVGEGAQKGTMGVTPSTVTVKPYKAHVTMRFNEEVLWADEDYQLGVLSQLAAKTGPALARALDFGVIHGINPLSGAQFAPMTVYLRQTTNSVEMTATSHVADTDALAQLIIADGYVPDGLAVDPLWATGPMFKRDPDGRKLYPDFQLSTQPFQFEAFRTAVSDTVSALGTAAVATTVRAIMGDWDQLVWGVQRRIGVERILYGDPDGQGDLKRNNQIALRAEVVYGWAIGSLNAFGKIIDAV